MKLSKMVLCIALLALIGCANSARLVDNSYKSLAVGKQTYESTMEIMAGLDMAPETIEKAVIWGTMYVLSHNTAVSALLVYEATQTEEAKQALTFRMSEAATRLSDLLLYVHKEVKK